MPYAAFGSQDRSTGPHYCSRRDVVNRAHEARDVHAWGHRSARAARDLRRRRSADAVVLDLDPLDRAGSTASEARPRATSAPSPRSSATRCSASSSASATCARSPSRRSPPTAAASCPRRRPRRDHDARRGGHAPRADPAPAVDARRLRVPAARRDRAPEPRARHDPRVRPVPGLLLHEPPGGDRPGPAPRATEATSSGSTSSSRPRSSIGREARDLTAENADDMHLRHDDHERLLGARPADGGDAPVARPREGQGLRDGPRPLPRHDGRARRPHDEDAEGQHVRPRHARVRQRRAGLQGQRERT